MSAIRVMVDGKPEWRVERDPYWSLTQRQRRVLDTVRAHGGNRTRAAVELRITPQAVKAVLRIAARAGVAVPDGATRGPDRQPRKGSPVRCGYWMPRSNVPCARGNGHEGAHRDVDRRYAA